MTAPPRWEFQVAMGLGATDVPGPSDWTDLSDRIMHHSGDVGRSTEFDEFQCGSAMVTLDNSDRQLDPSVTGALNELAAGKGLPRCPARLRVDWDGATSPWITGVLGEEPWIPDDAPHGATGTVTVEVVDMMARDAGLELVDDLMWAAVMSLSPSWWGRVIDSLTTVPDFSANNDPGTYLAGTGPVITRADPLVPSTGLPAIEMHAIAIELPAALDGPTADFTVFVVFRADSSAQNQTLARKPSTATNPGWRLIAGPGAAYVEAQFFAPGGTPLQQIRVSSTGGGAHAVMLRVEGGVEARLHAWSAAGAGTSPVGGFAGTWTSGSVPTGWEGKPRFGDPANTLTPAVAEMVYWDGTIVGDVPAVALMLVAAGGTWILVPTTADRIAAWQALAGSSTPVQVHPTSLVTLAAVEDVPATLGDGYREAAEAGRGATYALRDGTIRVRTIEALTDPSLAADYTDPVAHLTDEPSPAGSPRPVRRSPVKWSGPRLAEVCNASVVTYRAWLGEAVVMAEDAASIARFGRRERRFASNYAAAEHDAMLAIAQADVARYAWPRRRMDKLTIQPLLDGVVDDEDALRFVIEDLELEKAVDVTWTPVGGSPVTETVNVQGISWDWSPSQWTVTLALAES